MKRYQEMTREELLQEKECLEAEYKKIQEKGLALDMSRGKPGADQLALATGVGNDLGHIILHFRYGGGSG